MEPKPPTNHTTSHEPLSCGEIAKRLGRSRYGVKKALQRIGVQPSAVLGGISYYPPGVLRLLDKSMRQPNLQAPPI